MSKLNLWFSPVLILAIVFFAMVPEASALEEASPTQFREGVGAPLSVPGPATLIGPTGVQTTNTPTYEWNIVSDSPWYQLSVSGPGGYTFVQWYESATICGTTCSVVGATPNLAVGDYTWKVQTWNSAGVGPWSTVMSFSTPAPAAPGAATPIGPTGVQTTGNPTYEWAQVTESTWYQLSVTGPSGYAFTKWYESTAVCVGSSCSVAGATPGRGNGDYTWKVQTWSSAGVGPWSTVMNFTIDLPTAPGAATPVGPLGVQTTNNPTYEWNKVATSSWYQLSVSGPSSYAFTKWYQSSEVCGSGSTCSIAGATPNLAFGDYTWKVQTWSSAGAGPWSATMSFSTPAPAVPAAATLVSPTGSVGTNTTPTYTWNTVSDSTYYYLWVDGPSGNVLKTWYTSSDAHCTSGGTCWVTPTTALGGGSYTWKVQTWSSAGVGPWSTTMNFTVDLPTAPGAATPVGPLGVQTTNNPTYEWSKVTTSTWYQLSVSGPGGYAFTKWYDGSTICGTTCSVVGATPNLAVGSFSWKVQTWNSAGAGPWSAITSFSTPTPVVPTAATPVGPTGAQTTSNPTYEWTKVTTSTWYYLSVSGPSGYTFTQWYESAVVCTTTCSVAGATPGLAGGAYTWKVQTWSSAGYGPWSSPNMSFSIPSPLPVQPTLISPGATSNDLTPTYIWNAVSSETGNPATWYYLSVDASPTDASSGGNILAKWYTAEEVGCTSGTGTCTITPSTPLTAGSIIYTWNVYGWNAAGSGPLSATMSFRLLSLGGFGSTFDGLTTGWSYELYTWFNENSAYLTTFRNPEDGPHSKAAYYSSSAYANFDYSARVYRSGCEWCDNFLYVRGTPSPLDEEGYWNNGYQFTYANDGTFSVWKVIDGWWTLMQDYTYTSAIIPGGWNTLRVIASGRNLFFYINNTLVWTGADDSFSSGSVGFGADNFETVVTPNDRFRVDWAILSSYVP